MHYNFTFHPPLKKNGITKCLYVCLFKIHIHICTAIVFFYKIRQKKEYNVKALMRYQILQILTNFNIILSFLLGVVFHCWIDSI